MENKKRSIFSQKAFWFGVISGMVISGCGLISLLILVVSNRSATNLLTPTTMTGTPTLTGPATTFGDGDWVVGTDIAPGTYTVIVLGHSNNCIWERVSGFGGTYNEQIASGLLHNGEQAIVTISTTDAGFKSSDCGTWRLKQ